MSQSNAFAKVVAMVGNAAVQWRRLQGSVPAQALGTTPPRIAGDPIVHANHTTLGSDVVVL